MKKLFVAAAAAACMALGFSAGAAIENPQSVRDLLNRIGGDGTADRFVTVVDDTYASASGAEMFKISARDGKPCITGTTLSAVTTGLGWYLNHTANVNLAWNNPHVELTSVPVPAAVEEHTTAAAYRYYLNYCTFSYSMSTWTWERWQEEIDWMALHGINMPLQIIGLEEVWRKFLMEDCGYTLSEVSDFVAGPSFMAWFGMNNLQGHGGPNPEWWYERQAQLGAQINNRMRELGIEPVLPGFYQVPNNFAQKTGFATVATGSWCGFARPHLVSVDDEAKLKEFGAKYYQRLHEVLGKSKYYSMDPFHEGGQGTTDYALKLYQKLYDVMDAANPDSKWVIQQWQWNGHQWKSLDGVPQGRLIVLDLNSERVPNYTQYRGHETVFSTIFNFGGRTGFDGRFGGLIDEYFKSRNTAAVVGLGAAPEAIEQTPVMYDLLFELPWMAEKPDAAEWMAQYAKRRYGADSPEAAEAWEQLRTSALALTGNLQGPHEAIICSRPALDVNKVSSWGGADIFYDRSQMTAAAYNLLDANLSGLNYSFDLADIARQALTDYSKSLLAGIKEAYQNGDAELFNLRRDAFLQLILDIDRLLNTNKEFMLGHWTKRARAMADEVSGTTDADRDWLELNNARTIISTWGEQTQSENGGLRDYSYREWGGYLKDFYYQRWKLWFDNGMKAPASGWFQWEWNWAHTNANAYDDTPVGDTRTVAAELLPKYMSKFTSKLAEQSPIYVDRLLTSDYKKKFFDRAAPESEYVPEIDGGAEVVEIAIDFSTNGRYEDNEVQKGASFTLGADAPVGERTCRVTLADGTVVTYTVKILVNVTDPRTVSVATSNAEQGSVSIDGTDALSVITKEPVVMRASAASLYDFDHWEDADGNNVGNDNPLTYYAKGDASFTAHFVINKWGVPDTSKYAGDKPTIESMKQYVKSMAYTQNGESTEFYSTETVPDNGFVQVPTRIKAAPGGEFSFNWTDAGGLNWLFLSAYVDLNSDGTFEMDRQTELLGTFGEYHSNNNPQVAAGEFKVLLPYETKLGTTHIRLRFDSSWNDPAWNAEVGCFRPDGPTNRFVYEILLEVVESPDYACTVTYGSNNSALGSMRSENETMVYNPGEEVIITAFPNPGVRVARWVDNHGRELPKEWVAADGNSVNFKAYDNANITAEFETLPLQAGGYSLDWELMSNGMARVTGATETEAGHLDLSEPNPTVGSVATGAFDGVKSGITKITLPNAQFLDDVEPFFTAAITGDGTENKVTQVTPEIAGTDSWTMTIVGSTNGASFNAWGSGIYGNGTNCLADNFSNGWSQFYLTKAGKLQVKWDSGTAVTFDGVTISGDFSIMASYAADAKKITITVASNGQSQVKEISNTSTMKPISRFATALPAGINFTISFSQPQQTVLPGEVFSGFGSVSEYAVAGNNSFYSVTDGVAYAKGSPTKVVAYPEEHLSRYAFAMKQGSKLAMASPTASAGALATDSENMEVYMADGEPWHSAQALWRICPSANGTCTLAHINTGCSLGAPGQALEMQGGSFSYKLVYGSDGMPSIKFLNSAGKHVAAVNGTFDLSDNEASFTLDVRKTISVVAPATDFTLTMPCELNFPEKGRIYFITAVTPEKGVTMAETLATSGHVSGAVLVRGVQPGDVLEFPIPEELVDMRDSNADKNLLRPATVNLKFPGNFYLLESDGKFRLHTSGTVPANSAYMLKSSLPEGLGDEFALDGSSTICTVVGADAPAKRLLYDLQGRKVESSNPAAGIYIDAEGNKILIR